MIWAAVDLLDGQCVQLRGGDPNTARFNQDPIQAARHWVAEGADGLHLIDLSAALGNGDNGDLIARIIAAVDLPVQVGGGIRDEAAIARWLKLGASCVIVGTRGVKEPQWLKEMTTRFPHKIILAVDARGEEVTVSGWTEGSGISLFDLAEAVNDLALAGLLYTNVDIEGSLQGIDPTPVLKLCTMTRLPVQVSGGLRQTEDVLAAYQLGAAGVVLGTALYADKIRLPELKAAMNEQNIAVRSTEMNAKDWVRVQRKTRETEIDFKLRLHGSGKVKLDLEPYFLRHMLESFALHGRFDLEVAANGEDEHHLIEDVGICLGQAIRQMVSNLKVERIAHVVVPMDEALVMVVVDLVDRPFAQVELPDFLYEHFMRSLALDGKFTLHVRPLAGVDPHHVVEAAFKGLGRALRQAVRPVAEVSSTKGEVAWR